MRSRPRLGAALAIVLLSGTISVAAPTVLPVVHAAGYGAGGEYQPLATPVRIFDSRPGSAVNDPAPGAKPIGSTPGRFNIQLTGTPQFNVPASDVLSVVVSITVTEPTIGGYLGAFPAGSEPSRETAIVNYAPGSHVANMAIVRPGANGQLTISLGSDRPGGTHVLVDVFGYFTTTSGSVPAGAGGRLETMSPQRLVDTRESGGAPGSHGELTVTIRGAANVPNTADVVGALVNITGITPTEPTFISAVPNPTGGAAPSTSNVNLVPGQVKANLAMVPVGSDGAIRLYNANGTTHLAVDIFGYLIKNRDPNTARGRIVPLAAPFRAFDTREMGGQLGPGQAEDWSFANFANSVTINGQPLGDQASVIGNLTATDITRQYPSVYVGTFLTAWPPSAGATPPLISNINAQENTVVANMGALNYDGSKVVRVYNYRGYINYIFDAAAVVMA